MGLVSLKKIIVIKYFSLVAKSKEEIKKKASNALYMNSASMITKWSKATSKLKMIWSSLKINCSLWMKLTVETSLMSEMDSLSRCRICSECDCVFYL